MTQLSDLKVIGSWAGARSLEIGDYDVVFGDLFPEFQQAIQSGQEAEALRAEIARCDAKAADLIVRAVDAEEKVEALEAKVKVAEEALGRIRRGPNSSESEHYFRCYWIDVICENALAKLRGEK